MPKVFYLFISIFSFSLLAQVISYEVTDRIHGVHTFEEVCQYFGHRHNLLINRASFNSLDCMGEKVTIDEFCLAQASDHPDRLYLRGFIPKVGEQSAEKEVFCVFGQAVSLVFSCEGEGLRNLCADLEAGCLSLRPLYAHQAHLIHHARQFKEESELLQCRFMMEKKKSDASTNKSINAPHIPPSILENL